MILATFNLPFGGEILIVREAGQILVCLIDRHYITKSGFSPEKLCFAINGDTTDAVDFARGLTNSLIDAICTFINNMQINTIKQFDNGALIEYIYQTTEREYKPLQHIKYLCKIPDYWLKDSPPEVAPKIPEKQPICKIKVYETSFVYSVGTWGGTGTHCDEQTFAFQIECEGEYLSINPQDWVSHEPQDYDVYRILASKKPQMSLF